MSLWLSLFLLAQSAPSTPPQPVPQEPAQNGARPADPPAPPTDPRLESRAESRVRPSSPGEVAAPPAGDPPRVEPPAARAEDSAAAPAPTALRTPPRPPINAIQFVVNDQAVTRREFLIDLQRRNEANATEQDLERNLQRTFADRVRDLLMEQGGRDLGHDPALIQRYIDDEIDREVEQAGGIIDLSSTLKRSRLDPVEFRRMWERKVYRDLWGLSVEGRQPGAGGRVHVDRYVRPGKLWFEFQRVPMAEIAPVTADFQSLLISAEAAGGAMNARTLADDLVAQARAGADFTELVRKRSHGAESQLNDGWERGIPIDQLATRFEDVADFLRSAAPGEVSEPLPIRVQEELVGFYIVASVTRHEPKVDFQSAEAQSALRQRMQESLGRYRRDRAIDGMLDSAFVWPRELFTGGPAR